MANLVNTQLEALRAIEALNNGLPLGHSDMTEHLNQAHAFYVLEENGKTLFGFSKFVGYAGLSVGDYLKNYQSLDGRDTEHALKPWFEEVPYGSPRYNALVQKLTTWMAQYDAQPRSGPIQKPRIFAPKR